MQTNHSLRKVWGRYSCKATHRKKALTYYLVSLWCSLTWSCAFFPPCHWYTFVPYRQTTKVRPTNDVSTNLSPCRVKRHSVSHELFCPVNSGERFREDRALRKDLIRYKHIDLTTLDEASLMLDWAQVLIRSAARFSSLRVLGLRQGGRGAILTPDSCIRVLFFG